jgi:hypothetical protein
MENDIFNFLRPSLPEEEHPLDSAVNFWIRRNGNYKKLLVENRLVKSLISAAKLAIKDKAFLEEHSTSFVNGWILFSIGIKKNDLKLIDEAESLFKPMVDEIIKFMSSDAFRKYVLEQHVTGEEKIPVSIPEVFVSVRELLLFSRQKRSLIISKENVDELKKDFIDDKIESWGLNGEFGDKIKKLETILYPEIFNPMGYLAFQQLMKNQKTKGYGVQADISYFFHKLKGIELIHAKKEKFLSWLAKFYPDFSDIDRLHNLERIDESFSRKDRLAQALDFIGLKK